MEKWNYSHQFILKNNPDYLEVVQNDLYNYYECNCPTVLVEKNNAIIYKIGQKIIKIKKIDKNTSQIGTLIIDFGFSKGKSRIDITTEDKKVITVYEKLNQTFLEDINSAKDIKFLLKENLDKKNGYHHPAKKEIR